MGSKILRPLICGAICLLSASAVCRAQETAADKGQASAAPVAADKEKEAFRQDIKKLMELTGSKQLQIQIMTQMINSFRKGAPQVPAKFWDDFLAEAGQSTGSLIEQCVPIYEKHLSHEDVKALIKFYETPAGQRVIKALPLITQESMTVGQIWGQQMAQKIMQKMLEKGYK